MKRLLLVVVLLVAPALFAETSDRATLLAPNGTLYTIESRQNLAPTSDLQSTRFLSLSIQNGQNVIHTNVPASITGGNNWQPALAFDDASSTLFVFWLRSQGSVLGTNELLFCTFQNGKWLETRIGRSPPEYALPAAQTWRAVVASYATLTEMARLVIDAGRSIGPA